MDMNPAVLCLGPSGLDAARRIVDAVGGELFVRGGSEGHAFEDTGETVRTLFLAGRPVVGICAAAILIRVLAPVLGDKRCEPPVLAVSDDGRIVVPLLGGHRGGNRLAGRVAEALGGMAAVTTAGDVRFGVALDDPPPGWRLGDRARAKVVSAALLAGGRVFLDGEDVDQAPWLKSLPCAPGADGAETVAVAMAPRTDGALQYFPLRATLGVGCSRGCPLEELAGLAATTLADAGIDPHAVAGVFSIDLKADEPAVLDLAERLGLPLRLFSAAELEQERSRLENPSETVFAETGCHGVAEAAALAGGGAHARLVVAKRKTARATCALGLAPAPITELRGRKRGKVMLVSTGPGQADWRSPEASDWVHRADELVGYAPYIDLLGPVAVGKPRRDFPLGGETDRCRYALERAGEGLDVALVCSGDAGIYAMGALVYELLARPEAEGGVSARARRVEVVSTPGISAFQAAAARAGAPIGHDFCAISLSDLLTPRETILRRVEAAAAGDFVIAFYNPVSKTRRELLDKARGMLLQSRPAETPVLLAARLGRPGESLEFRTLETLRTDEVDMLTVVLVGSSQTRLIETAGGLRMFTPRGYAVRIEERPGKEGA